MAASALCAMAFDAEARKITRKDSNPPASFIRHSLVEASTIVLMSAFLQDLRYAVRTLRRSAGLTFVIVASLAIGIGANTAVFSVVNALLLKPLPYPAADRLAVLWLRSPGINIPQDWPSPGQYLDVKDENRSFEEMSISQGRSGTIIGRGGE